MTHKAKFESLRTLLSGMRRSRTSPSVHYVLVESIFYMEPTQFQIRDAIESFKDVGSGALLLGSAPNPFPYYVISEQLLSVSDCCLSFFICKGVNGWNSSCLKVFEDHLISLIFLRTLSIMLAVLIIRVHSLLVSVLCYDVVEKVLEGPRPTQAIEECTCTYLPY